MNKHNLNYLILEKYGSKRAFMRAMNNANYPISYRALTMYCHSKQRKSMTIARAEQMSQVLNMPVESLISTIINEGDE